MLDHAAAMELVHFVAVRAAGKLNVLDLIYRSKMNLSEAKAYVLNLMGQLTVGDRYEFLLWAKELAVSPEFGISNRDTYTNEDVILESIKEDLRVTLPINALSPSENILCPSVGVNADCHPSTTVHVDAFLYDEDAIDKLCDVGKMSRSYCKRCGSKETSPLTFISHSMSRTQLKYLFQFALPDLRGKTLVDVGSRLGSVLYAAYVYSSAQKIIGIEINNHFCEIQQKAITKYAMQDRTLVLCADVCAQRDVLAIADVVVLHNVFEFFIPLEEQARVWNFLHQSIRKSGTILIVSPGLEESQRYIEVDFDHRTWVKPVQDAEVLRKANARLFDDSKESDLENIHFYEVI